MKNHNIERLSALADGELRGLSRWLTRRHLRHCAHCAAELQRIERVRATLAACPLVVEMSDSEEFFWSKVSREIERRGAQTESVAMPRLTLADWLRVNQAAWVSATAALVAACGLWMTMDSPMRIKHSGVVTIEGAETGIPNASVTPIKGVSSDVGVIWLTGMDWASDMDDMKQLLNDSTVDSDET